MMLRSFRVIAEDTSPIFPQYTCHQHQCTVFIFQKIVYWFVTRQGVAAFLNHILQV